MNLVIIVAGGTAGHIIPGLIVGEMLIKKGWNVIWVGNPRRMERVLVSRSNIEMIPLDFCGLPKSTIKSFIVFPFQLLKALVASWKILANVKPNFILGMGGYITVPVCLIAALRGIPIVIHEQNAIAGRANKLLSNFAKIIFGGYPNILPKSEHVGNPIRSSMYSFQSPDIRYSFRNDSKLRLLVLGGSLGAQRLNFLVPAALSLLSMEERPYVTHQSGEKHIKQLCKNYDNLKVSANCIDYIEDVAEFLSNVDLVICRAGAITVSEIVAIGVAALFIPFPYATDNHQMENIKFLVDSNAAWVIHQDDVSPEWLASWIKKRTRSELCKIAMKANKFVKPFVLDRIVDTCESFKKNSYET
ncbi:UDP-N-acetylglucosamine--N-acetylmuramyl-(pentapeptide) pyrophosphoryl-undecaprenol N-acetylglucosamine transferase MurG [Candidatus Kinetoplastibacterium blastocrithidii TCC012E]|uniref:UDP-N-acetylglucosamine--N-acetylmuramyl-(pentapeptide) pyrophosphoryl-undecaprenol N-acetylglucosamine transferase n=1 Tax=Candidatus Kinetoplastidibacterium blastocrithidiae TCC012E TaxID=1208922 RepID=M1ME38_9PROT|nr:undecaprenyldiphospho-muramoylpentapeptide beta-N-acetylglucosaminyltransferase [Candidatus Kinetoplastibacterium blastocrithidii]AFZ83876.1 undecaprenyldiphospho-muramoylpentapeptide beta-N-acetylglucosaminyltransferase [Candidatus Kinetoplastibacterium blastocrithidii (ex Strigomonas culicis)]AGF49995.1 UDP-N-acetylglucosamine--N-acetylmuramyl-(pentapeptide) pyrophosphoryl-undecaprenol N-acetylglucosamine transferase MurG [Candidatus Kinetoplastibacterium blastocrithidii TCC012E]